VKPLVTIIQYKKNHCVYNISQRAKPQIFNY